MTKRILTWLGDLPLQKKMTLLIMMTCGLTLMVSSLAFVVLEIHDIREEQELTLESLATVIASNTAAALTFGDTLVAEETISALSVKEDILAAYVLDRDGQVFARHATKHRKVKELPLEQLQVIASSDPVERSSLLAKILPARAGYDASADIVSVQKVIFLDQQAIGTLLVYADGGSATNKIQDLLSVSLMIMLVAFGCAYLLSARLQKVISGPLHGLVDTMREVSETKNFNLRAVEHGQDEIGHLCSEFNGMLEALAERDTTLRDFQKELQQKNAELERFTYPVSHDLKSPLITIQGFVGFLEERLAGTADEVLKKDLAQIRSAANKMYNLLNDLLELSRVGRIHNPESSVELEQITHDTVQSLEGLLQVRPTLIKVASPLPKVFGDRLRLREVMQNLLENAIKYMGNQQHPCIEVGIGDTHLGRACYVRDNGLGIPGRYHDKVFGLFERLDADSEGTGIGLALVKRIIELHGGSIWIESEGNNRGTTFWFTLPWEQD